MTRDATDAVPTIDRPGVLQVVEALWLLFQDEPPSERALHAAEWMAGARNGTVSLAYLFQMRRDDRLVGAVHAQPLPGRVAIVSPPRLRDRRNMAAALRLITHLHHELAADGFTTAQALLDVGQQRDADLLGDTGYQRVADLEYLMISAAPVSAAAPAAAARGWAGAGESPPRASALRFEAYHPSQRTRLESVIVATYHGTLDIPELNGLRTIGDTVDGYQQTGRHRPEYWYFVRHANVDVGCLLLTYHSAGNSWELIYMGLTPEYRGRGWGRQIIRQAKDVVFSRRTAALVVAVDARNAPAVRAYCAEGFQVWARKAAFVKTLAAAAANP